MDEIAAKRAKQCFARAEEPRGGRGHEARESRTSILRLADNYERMGLNFERAANDSKTALRSPSKV